MDATMTSSHARFLVELRGEPPPQTKAPLQELDPAFRLSGLSVAEVVSPILMQPYDAELTHDWFTSNARDFISFAVAEGDCTGRLNGVH
jgi:hypothetical protein